MSKTSVFEVIILNYKMYYQSTLVRAFNHFRYCYFIKFKSYSTDKLQLASVEQGSCSKVEKMAKKLRTKTPIGKLDELEEGTHPQQEKEPLKRWPNETNPFTGEIGGPKGPEPTRYGDWERKGRVTDF